MPPVTEAVISPSLAPKQLISDPLKFDETVADGVSSDGGVIVKNSIDGIVEHPFASVTT